MPRVGKGMEEPVRWQWGRAIWPVWVLGWENAPRTYGKRALQQPFCWAVAEGQPRS